MSQARISVYVDERDEEFVRGLIQDALRTYAGTHSYNLTAEPVRNDATVTPQHHTVECFTNADGAHCHPACEFASPPAEQ